MSTCSIAANVTINALHQRNQRPIITWKVMTGNKDPSDEIILQVTSL